MVVNDGCSELCLIVNLKNGWRSNMDAMLIAIWDGQKANVYTDISMSSKSLGHNVLDLEDFNWDDHGDNWSVIICMANTVKNHLTFSRPLKKPVRLSSKTKERGSNCIRSRTLEPCPFSSG